MGNLVWNASQQIASGAAHSFTANDDQTGAACLSCLQQGFGGVSEDRMVFDTYAAVLEVTGGVVQNCERATACLLIGLSLGCASCSDCDCLKGTDEVDLGSQRRRQRSGSHHGYRSRFGTVRADHDGPHVRGVSRLGAGSRYLHVLLRNTPHLPANGRFHPSRVTADRSSWPLLQHRARSISQAQESA
jgi:hypothetical protein